MRSSNFEKKIEHKIFDKNFGLSRFLKQHHTVLFVCTYLASLSDRTNLLNVGVTVIGYNFVYLTTRQGRISP